jgi:hypothetical protein
MFPLADGTYSEALRLLGRVVVATQPYADQLLVIGGMVPMLYRRAPGFARARLAPPATTEVDMTVPPRLAVADRPMVDLLRDADLKAFEAPGYRGRPGAQAFQDVGYPRRDPQVAGSRGPSVGLSAAIRKSE